MTDSISPATRRKGSELVLVCPVPALFGACELELVRGAFHRQAADGSLLDDFRCAGGHRLERGRVPGDAFTWRRLLDAAHLEEVAS
ncbi:hypothetical protein UFOVP1383_56 [uncultured Caudovirales phage]|uniref:Uncharacterized protein n=1 Tax=uncultured Caudovirales phage TaxID=2100421 RepID=A0A6J5SNA5_9CAUD|nr:hypothetical protein UFOVP848_44 [uncultured Caudovirales phage]CAB4173150.1 hypothetical protein UFOVP945_21 [uncultured Caudovirales phage]CAB4179625.1 hypothetical protein UFOVP1023_21 [uncultured Caudovirales phage]CAB4204334.1 hypothetical protein UFOVP1383_56 [uncultured Caudovirales phage]CAB4216059.1 hypothetical protein UFOVP1477_51 [uncultured Caudovirales phage]